MAEEVKRGLGFGFAVSWLLFREVDLWLIGKVDLDLHLASINCQFFSNSQVPSEEKEKRIRKGVDRGW